MDRNFAKSLSLVLAHEGEWSDHPKDPGGATMKGVTLATFRSFVKPNATKEDLRKITAEQIATVYRRHYWDATLGAKLPDGVDYAVLDFAVSSGPARAAKHLQAVVGVAEDGKIGPATLSAIAAMPAHRIINDLCDRRLKFLKGIKKGEQWKVFGKGWNRRVEGVRAEALVMAAQPTPERPTVIEKEVTVEVPVPVEKPVVPEKVEKEVRSKTNWVTGIFGTGGAATALATWLAGMDRDALILMGIIFVVSMVTILVGGEWIVRRVKSIRKEIEA